MPGNNQYIDQQEDNEKQQAAAKIIKSFYRKNRAYKQTHEHTGVDIEAAAKSNLVALAIRLRKVEGLIHQPKDPANPTENDKQFQAKLDAERTAILKAKSETDLLTPQEQKLTDTMLGDKVNWTLRHGTMDDNFEKIQQQDNTLLSKKELERRGILGVQIRTPATNGIDDNVFFTLNLGANGTSYFLNKYSHSVVTINYDKVLRENPEYLKGLWISSHWYSFDMDQDWEAALYGDTRYQVIHRKELENDELVLKQLHIFERKDGQRIIQPVLKGEDTFTIKQDLKYISALRLVERLRLLGGTYRSYVLSHATDPDVIENATNALFHVAHVEAKIPQKIQLKENYISTVRPEEATSVEGEMLAKDIEGAARNKKEKEVEKLLGVEKEHLPDPIMLQKALKYAIEEGSTGIVKLLLDKGCNIYRVETDTFLTSDALTVAAEHCQLECMRLLLEYGSAHREDLHIRYVSSVTPWSPGGRNHVIETFVKQKNHTTEMVELLIKHGATELNKALFIAVETGRIDTAELLIRNGADVNFHQGRYTPLIRAVQNADIAMTTMLLENGATVNARILNGVHFGTGLLMEKDIGEVGDNSLREHINENAKPISGI